MITFESNLLGKYLKDARGTILRIVAVWLNETGTHNNVCVMGHDAVYGSQRLVTLPDTDYTLHDITPHNP